jgi:hypothetical protein
MSLSIPHAEVKVNGTEVVVQNLIEVNIHLGCTKEVSSFEVVVNNGNSVYYAGDYSRGKTKEFVKGSVVTIKVKRGVITVDTSYLFTGTLGNCEYIDEAEDYAFRNVVILRGRCRGKQFFSRKFDGNLSDNVGVTYRAYHRGLGEAESLVAYLIDNYTTLEHFRESTDGDEDASSSQKDVVVVDSSFFSENDLVRIIDDNSWEYNQIDSIDGNTLTMKGDLVNDYAVIDSLRVDLDLIRASNTSYTLMRFEHETIFDIIKFIADTASTVDGVIGYDFRCEHDGCFAWLPRGLLAEPYGLEEECQLHRLLDDAERVKNTIWVYGKADKPYPLDLDGQAWSDSLTDLDAPSVKAELNTDAFLGQKDVVLVAGEGARFLEDDWVFLMDTNVGSGELIQIDGISGDTLTMKTNLTKDCLLASWGIVFLVYYNNSQVGWGFEPEGDENQLEITAGGTVREGYNSVSVHLLVSGNWCKVMLVFKEPVNLNDYPEIIGSLYFNTIVPKNYRLTLLSGNCGANEWADSVEQSGLSEDQWLDMKIEGGEKNAKNWWSAIDFNWTNVRCIVFDVLYEVNGNHTFFIDRLYLSGKRWGGGSDDEAVDGFAEATDSQIDYGPQEHVVISDMLLSDAECEAKAQSLKSFYRSPRLSFELFTKSLDWGDNHLTAGNRTGILLTGHDIQGWYRIDSIDLSFSADFQNVVTTFMIENAPLRTADYLYALSRKIRELERSYSTIR